jgi:hypothetical protein
LKPPLARIEAGRDSADAQESWQFTRKATYRFRLI